jgi:hypothetical protein
MFSNRFFRSSLLAAGLVGVSCGVGVAQSTASLSGTVTDPTGAVVPDATVTVHSLGTGTDRVVTTDSGGNYVVPSLQPGAYQVVVKATGFALYTVQSLTLQVDRIVTVSPKLALESAGATVDVTSAAPLIDAQTMTVGQVIGKRTVQELPLNGRHFLDLTVLTPGGVTPPATGNLTFPLRGLGASSFITAGNREDSVNFQMNGVNLNDMVQNQVTFQPSINTTSEFKIDNSTPSAEYGRSSGSVVNVSTRSGTNAFHGEAFDYLRNNYFDGRNYFNRKGTPQSAFKRNNFGAALGGPIWKDHTFFFASYEALRQRQGIFFNSAVLTAAERATALAVNNPAVVALLPLIPLANDSTGGRYTASAPAPVDVDQYTGDVLHQFNQKNTLHGFYAFQSDKRGEPNLQGNTVSGFGDHRTAHRQVLTFNDTHVFNPKMVNEARLGFNRISIEFAPATPLNPVDYHIADGVTTAIGIPQISLADKQLNFGGPAGFPQGRHDTLMIFSDTATYLTGKNTIKFGGEFRRFVNDNFTGDTGSMGFNTTTGFINGLANSFAITPTTVSSRIFVNAGGLFVQDNYKLTPRLLLEAGLRFEWNGTPTEGANRFVVFQPATLSLVQTNTHGQGGVYKQNYNVEPRLGFAYDVRGTGKTVVRGGYGLMADQPTSNLVTGLASNPPFANRVSYSSSTAPIPITSLYASANAVGIGLNNIQPDYRNAYTQTYNLNLQQELPYQIAITAGYYGSVGRHLRAISNQNQPINGGARPYTMLSASSPIAPGASINSNIAYYVSNSSSNYNALWISAAKSFAKGFEFNTNYNYSKSMDLNSLGSQGGYAYQDSTNPAGNYGLSDYDLRHRIAGTAIYNLPFKGNRLVEGFQISTIVQWQTGNPLTVVNNSTYGGVANVRPNLVGAITKAKAPTAQNGVSWITSKSCTSVAPTAGCTFWNPITAPLPPNGAGKYVGFGNMQRNSITGPGFTDVDLSLQKNTKIYEGVTLQLRADGFDVMNHTNLGNPVTNDQSGIFGQIFSTRFPIGDVGSARQIQLSAKVLF